MKEHDDKVVCETPKPGKKPTRIERWKYEAVRAAIMNVLPTQGKGVAFKDLPDLVAGELSDEIRSKLGSVGWYTTTVKLDLEVKGEIRRVKGSKPQRLIRIE